MKILTLSEKRKQIAAAKKIKKAKSPPQELLIKLLELYQTGQNDDVEKLAVYLTQEFPYHQFGWKVLGAILAKTKRCGVDEITVCILERPRHEDLIEEVRIAGASIRLITDGDVAGVMHCAESEKTGIDIYMGSGGAPEGVLAAAALKCMGGQIQGRLTFRNDDEKKRAYSAGITDLNKIYSRDEMVMSDVIFAATGVTDGSLLNGVRRSSNFIETDTMLMRSRTGSVRRLNYRQKINR